MRITTENNLKVTEVANGRFLEFENSSFYVSILCTNVG